MNRWTITRLAAAAAVMAALAACTPIQRTDTPAQTPVFLATPGAGPTNTPDAPLVHNQTTDSVIAR